MQERDRRRIPAGLIGALALVVALDAGHFRRDRFRTDQSESWRLKGSWASGPRASGAEILVLGDSLLEFGVLPRVLQDRTGRRALNLALHNGSPAAAYVLFRRALGAGARPAAVVVDFMPHQLALGPRHEAFLRSWPGLLSGSEALELAVALRDPAFLARTLAARALAVLDARHEVRASIVEALRGGPPDGRQMVAVLRRHWEANLGAQVAAARVSRPVDGFDDLFPPTWQCDPTTEAYVRRFLELAEAHRIPVLCLIPPLRPGAEAWRARRDLDRPYLDFLRSLRVDHPGLTVVDGRGCGYDEGLFADAVHLNRRGAEALSAALADVVIARAGRGPAGHVRLAPFRGADRPAPGVEDLDESRIAWLRDQRRPAALRR